jgi:hypothetical protein
MIAGYQKTPVQKKAVKESRDERRKKRLKNDNSKSLREEGFSRIQSLRQRGIDVGNGSKNPTKVNFTK